MRGPLSVVVLAAVALLVGCADDTSSAPRHGTSSKTGSETKNPDGTTTTTGTGTATPSAAVMACTAVTAPTSLSDAKDAIDVHLAGTAVFFQSGTNVQRVLKTGDNKKTIFTSPNLIHSYADKTGLLLVEQTDAGNPNATLRAFAANGIATDENPNPTPSAFPEFPVQEGDDPGGTTAATNFNSASVKVFGSNSANFYVQADTANGDTQILMYPKATLAATVLVTSQKVISNPQVASGAIWYVEDNQRIFKVALATDDQPAGEPKEVFGISYQQCNLAVNETSAFCSVGTAIESRDLTGASPKTLIDNAASKTAAPFGVAQYSGGRLIVQSGAPDKEIKSVIRSLSTTGAADEKFVACGRNAVTGVAVDETNVVWTEEGAGVFVTTR